MLAGARLVFPADSYGLIVHAKHTLDSATVAATCSANGTIIERLSLTGGGTSGTTGSGIWMRGQAFVRDCRITAFAENGVKIRAGIGGGLDTEGNANLWRLEGVLCEANGKDGIFVNGADVNAGYCIGADCRNNGRWGIFDSSFLGNTYMACHTNLNGVAGKGGNPAGSSSRVEQGGNIYEANQHASEAALVAHGRLEFRRELAGAAAHDGAYRQHQYAHRGCAVFPHFLYPPYPSASTAVLHTHSAARPIPLRRPR